MTVGHGHFKSSKFCRISATSLSSCGGLVVVGPFSTTSNTAEEIRLAAFEKFSQQNRIFRKKYKSSDQVYLLFPDGSRVEGLPNKKDGMFSIIAYRNFVDPTKRFDRLRLYLCDKGKFRYIHGNMQILYLHQFIRLSSQILMINEVIEK